MVSIDLIPHWNSPWPWRRPCVDPVGSKGRPGGGWPGRKIVLRTAATALADATPSSAKTLRMSVHTGCKRQCSAATDFAAFGLLRALKRPCDSASAGLEAEGTRQIHGSVANAAFTAQNADSKASKSGSPERPFASAKPAPSLSTKQR